MAGVGKIIGGCAGAVTGGAALGAVGVVGAIGVGIAKSLSISTERMSLAPEIGRPGEILTPKGESDKRGFMRELIREDGTKAL
jgi:hypothetical protein